MSKTTPADEHKNRSISKVKKLEEFKKESNIFDASESGNLELVKELIEQEPGCVYKTDEFGLSTALHYAAKEGNIDVATYLIDSRSDINRKNQGSQTPLHIACELGRMNMVKLLLYKGADYNLTNYVRSGTSIIRETPRDVAEYNKFPKIVELLDKYDAHVKKKAAEAEQKKKEEEEKKKEESSIKQEDTQKQESSVEDKNVSSS